MNIIVCLKQVIVGSQVRIDPRTHRLIRSAESSQINPFDLYALDLAVNMKKEYRGFVMAVTMGPQIAEEVLWQAFALGADRGVLLSDPRFAGSDTLATSYVLGMGIRKIGGFDVILCGMRTTDSDTGQVGPQLAEELDLPHVTAVERLVRRGDRVEVERSSDGFREVLEVPPPALFTVAPIGTVRLPSLIEIEEAFQSHTIETWNLEKIGADPAKVGSLGSRTWVESFVPIGHEKSCLFIEGDPREQAKALFMKLVERGLVS